MLSYDVALATYNGAHYLHTQLASIEAQTARPSRVILCDDRSTDETICIARDFAATSQLDVRIELNGRNLGPTKNFERAAQLCTAPVIAFCDQDDRWPTDRADRLVRRLAADGSVTGVISNARLVDDALRPIGTTLWDSLGFNPGSASVLTSEMVIPWLIRNTIAFGATMVVRRSSINGGFPIGQGWGHDNWSAIVLAAQGRIGLESRVTLDYRQHQGQVSSAGIGKTLLERANDPGWRSANQTLSADSSAYLAILERIRKLPTRDEAQRALLVEGILEKAVHLRHRERIGRAGALRRLHLDLATGNYHRYSNGFGSWAKDVYLHVRNQFLGGT